MKKIALLLSFCSTLFSQTIDYSPQFPENDNGFVWERGLISGGILTFTVISIYNTGKPIYYNQPRGDFHFTKNKSNELEFFDNSVRGLDKFGHIFSSSLFSQNIYFMSRWSGLDKSFSSYSAFILASSIMGAMEVHDAYYKRWGFSIGDFVANVAGASFVVGQHNIPFLQNFDYKISYDFTRKKSDDAVIESYANMTFWVTANPVGLFKLKKSWLPNWINIATGISVTHSTPHKTEILLGLDFNLKRIKTNSVFLNHIIHTLDRYKFPAPAIRIAPDFIGYGIYF
ncbi:MAG: DUF2279 domain-containing protein [Calditrichaeota bacterium]|nr:DUF2279 domain-containing protein [Calditrichota bacterium]